MQLIYCPLDQLLISVTGFSPESGQLFSGVRACLSHVRFCASFPVIRKGIPVFPPFCVYFQFVPLSVSQLKEDLSTLWAFITFYGGDCQLNFNKKCTHLVVPEPKGVNSRPFIFFLFTSALEFITGVFDLHLDLTCPCES